MDFQDWKDVKWDKRGEKSKNESDKTFLNNQIRKGNVTQTIKKGSANQNKVNIVTNAKKIDSEEETFKHKLIGDIGKKIAQARCEKKLTQKQLANFLNLQESMVKNYETGKAIYNAEIVNRMEKFLEKKLR
jgi:ribosome-binding protein aMBF1 (putative translation factor)